MNEKCAELGLVDTHFTNPHGLDDDEHYTTARELGIIAAAALTGLPELLREFADYRMLVYAIVLILVMLATNNPTIRNLFQRMIPKRKNAEKEGETA